MHFPSGDIHKELLSGPGLWFVPAEGDDVHAILLKAKSNMIKAVLAGCALKIKFSIVRIQDTHILISSTFIYDEPQAPAMVFKPHIKASEFQVLLEILQRQKTPITFFDELARPIAWAQMQWLQDNTRIAKYFAEDHRLYFGTKTPVTSKALDIVSEALNSTSFIDQESYFELFSLDVAISEVRAIDIHTYGSIDDVQSFNALSNDEGGGFEQTVWDLLRAIFDGQMVKSPKVVEGKNNKELTDILAISKHCNFIFELKAPSILKDFSDRSAERKAKNLEKQIIKAINQIIGTVRSIRSEATLTTYDGRTIDFKRDEFVHGFVVVSEVLGSIDWEEITILVIEASMKHGICLHVMELEELSRLVIASETGVEMDLFLMKRFQVVIEQQSAKFIASYK